LIAKASEDDFGGEAGIAGVELVRVFHQEVGCVASGMDLAKDIEGDLAGGGNHANISCGKNLQPEDGRGLGSDPRGGKLPSHGFFLPTDGDDLFWLPFWIAHMAPRSLCELNPPRLGRGYSTKTAWVAGRVDVAANGRDEEPGLIYNASKPARL
jgi:hypothetical protein